MPRAATTAKYPEVYADIIILASNGKKPYRIENPTPAEAKSLRHKFYGFMRSAERELDKAEAAGAKPGVDVRMKEKGLTKEMIAQLVITVEGTDVVFTKRNQTPEAERLRASIEQNAVDLEPQAVPDENAFLKRMQEELQQNAERTEYK